MTHRPRHYVLDDDKSLVPVGLMEWARFFEDFEKRQVALTYHGKAFVSTIFLGLDHRYGEGPPLVFESMIFGGPLDQDYMDRYSSWDDALLGHRRAVLVLRSVRLSRNWREGRYLDRLARRKGHNSDVAMRRARAEEAAEVGHA